MKQWMILWIFFLTTFGYQPQSFAVGPCTICYSETGTECLHCPSWHAIDSGCLSQQLKTVTFKNPNHAQETSTQGLPCCGLSKEGTVCQHRLSLDAVQTLADPDIFEQFMKRLRGTLEVPSPESALVEKRRIALGEAHEFKEQIREAFNRSCPNCNLILDQVEGCNAATCEGCDTLFCNICLKKQEDPAAAHESLEEKRFADKKVAHQHARDHSGRCWENRDGHTGRVPNRNAGENYLESTSYEITEEHPEKGKVRTLVTKPYTYMDRYIWVLARQKLGSHPHAEGFTTEVLQEMEPFLKANKMWPFPVGKNTADWIQAVLQEPLFSSPLGKKNQIALLQNEYIYLLHLANESTDQYGSIIHQAESIKDTLKSLGARALSSLDVSRLDRRDRNASRFLIHEEDPAWESIPEGFRDIDPENIYIIRDPAQLASNLILSHRVRKKMNQFNAISFCESIGARLPTRDEYEIIASLMGKDRPGGYNRALIPEMTDWHFWTSTSADHAQNSGYLFDGTRGSIIYGNQIRSASVRCVVSIP